MMNLKQLTRSLIAAGAIAPFFAHGFTIADVRIEGEQHTSEATVHSLLPIKVGDTFDEQIGEQIIRNLHASGFYENVLLEQNGEQLIITVRERPIISELVVRGSKILPNEAILKQMSATRASQGSSDADLMRKDGDPSYDEKMETFETRSAYNTAQALATAGLGKGDFFSNEALIRTLRALDSAYREQGKNNVVITPEVVMLARNRVAITINIEEGETTKIRQLNFEGNEAFSNRQLNRQIVLNDGNLVSWFTKNNVFSWDKFNRDKIRLENFYRSRGYFDFRADFDDVQRQLSNDRTSETVTIKVYEGKKYHWGNFNIVGDTKEVSHEQLAKHLAKLKPGKLSDYDRLQEALAAIKLEMQSAGYAYAQVSSEADRIVDENGKDALNITITVSAGQKIAVREIHINGNNKTRDEVIRREIRQMESAPYDLEKINRSAQRLRQLGYFEEVHISAQPVLEDNRQTDLHVQVKERSTGSIHVAAGWSQDDGLILSSSVAQDNVFGTGKSASIGISRSKVNRNASISFTDPYFTPEGVSMTYNIFGSQYNPYKLNSNRRNYNTTRYGGSLIMGVPIGEYDRINVGLGAEQLTVNLRSGQPPYRYQRFVDENGTRNMIYKGIASWYRNTTDDATWPTKGYQASIDGEIGLPGSGLQYYQLAHQQTWYFPLSRHLTLLLNGQFGYSGHYGKTSEVPFMYNQTGGGLGSVRGYETSSLGPKVYDHEYCTTDTGGVERCGTYTESYGGKFAANANAELLFPFPGMQTSRSVRLSLFADAGSVWDGKTYNSGNYSIRNPYGSGNYYTGKHKSSFSNELRYSAGTALTWLSPMGPIKLSYAVPLKKQDNDLLQRFQFQLGTVF